MPLKKLTNEQRIFQTFRLICSGICGSDFHFMNNEMGKFSAKSDGVILGHEFSGTIVDLGKAAANTFKVIYQTFVIFVNPRLA